MVCLVSACSRSTLCIVNRQSTTSGGYLSLVRDASVLFAAAFGDPPRAAAIAPGRVNIIGDHIDYCGGTVLPMAINRWTAVAGTLRDDGQVCWAQHPDKEDAERDEDGKIIIPVASHAIGDAPPDPGSSMSYIVGTVRTLLEEVGQPNCGVDLAIASDVPVGAGLSSSSSLTLAVSLCVIKLTRSSVPTRRIAKLCQSVEHTWAGVPCGIMDQYAVAMGNPGHATMIDCDADTLAHIPLPSGLGFLVIDTGTRRSLATGEYAERRGSCDRVAAIAGVESLCRINASQLDVLDVDAIDLLRAKHVVCENARVRDAVNVLKSGDVSGLGAILCTSHASLRDLYTVSTPALDHAVDLVCEIPGVHGARMTGAGFGGCVIVAVDASRTHDIASRISTHMLRAIGSRAIVFAAHAVDGARSL